MSDALQRVVRGIKKDEVVALAKDLVNIPSPTGEEDEIAEYMVEWLDDAGLKATKQEVEPGRYNAVGKLPGVDPGSGSSLLFNGHIDTAQFGIELEDYWVYGEGQENRPFEAHQEGDRLYGAGMLNDKGPTAATFVAAKAIHDADVVLKNDLFVSGVVGELGKAPVDEFQGGRYKGHGIGARHLVTHGIVADYAIVAENSGWGIGYGLPGVLYLKLTVGGQPRYIPNIDYARRDDEHPIGKSMRVIDRIYEWAERYTEENRYEYDGRFIEPKVNVGAMRSGHPAKPNYQPGVSQIYVDIRIPPDRTPGAVRNELAQVVTEVDEEIEIEGYRAQKGYAPSVEDDPGMARLVGKVKESYQSVFGEEPPVPTAQNNKWNDNNIFIENGIPTVKIAPGDYDEEEGMIFTTDDLYEAAQVYSACALSICDVAT